MPDTTNWVRTYLDPNQNPAEVAARMNRLAAERGLPMAIPVPAPAVPVRGVQIGNSIVAHPDLQAAWDALAGGIRPKARPNQPQIRRQATGRARRDGGES